MREKKFLIIFEGFPLFFKLSVTVLRPHFTSTFLLAKHKDLNFFHRAHRKPTLNTIECFGHQRKLTKLNALTLFSFIFVCFIVKKK